MFSAHAPGTPSPAIVALAGMMALAVAMGIGRFAFTPLLPMMQDDAGLSVAQGGWLASANYAGYLLGALWAARQAVRSGAAIRAALLTIGLSTLGMGFAEGALPWLLLRTIAGAASAWALVHVSAWCLGTLAAARQPVLNGTVFAGVGCGIALTGGLCLVLMRLEAGSAQAWIALGVLSLAVAALLWPMLGVNGAAAAAPPAGGYRWTPDALRLVTCYGAFGLGYIIPATFLPLMAKQSVGSPELFGWAWPVFGVTAALSTLAAAPLLQLLGNRRLWMVAALAMAAGVAAPLVVPGLAGVIVAAVLVGGTFMIITMAGMQEARQVAGARAPTLMAAMTAAFAAGQVIGPLGVSYAADGEAAFPAALLVACALLVLSAGALAVKPKRKEQP